MKAYDRFTEEFVDESELDTMAPPERYRLMQENDYHLKDIMIFKDGVCIGHGLLDEQRMLIFSGYITCELAEKNGYCWSSGDEEEENDTM